jgi:cytochrome c-type biogenesis protein CcmH
MYWTFIGFLSLAVIALVVYPLRRRLLTVAVIVLALPAGAVPLYLYLGMPDQPDRPLVQRTEELKLAEQARQLDEYTRVLATRLEERPDDAEAWATLGSLYIFLRRFPESAEAFGRVHELRPEEADAAADHGEALVHASGGVISNTAEKMFATAVATDPKHAKARFYLGSALAQRPNKLAKAIEVWRDLEQDASPDAPWLDVLQRNLRLAEAELASLADAGPRTDAETGTPGTGGEE